MIFEYNHPGDPTSPGFATFSHDRKHRFVLGRKLTTRPDVLALPWIAPQLPSVTDVRRELSVDTHPDIVRIVFLMLNPSDADAFRPDPTVTRCAQFATRWGGEVLQVVNLFSFRTPKPSVLCKQPKDERGADNWNDLAILMACRSASRVIAAWGSGGSLDGRGDAVRAMLVKEGIRLERLRAVPSDGSPMHPLARGKHRIPDDQEPTPWV